MIVFKSIVKVLVFLSIISSINNFETLQNWKNNQNTSPFPSELSNSIVESYAINNSTGDILYLIKENDNSYLYINGNKYNNIYKDDLKYFTSPLFEYNGDYYFCSSSKNIIKFSLNGNIEKISNPDELNGYSGDYHLKCFYLSSRNIILVAFINTPNIEYYDLIISNWIDLNNKINMDKIIDVNIFDTKDVFMGILTKTESYYKFIPFSYHYNINMEMGNSKLINDTQYSKAMLSSGINKEEKKIFIFLYEPEDMNKYNFYEIEYWQIEFANKEGNLFLRMFREAQIYNAFFIENSPVLSYVIRKFEKDGKYNFYLGAVDIESLVLLYNIKLDDYKKVFYDNGYLYQDKLFLRYFEKGNQIELCPFIYDHEEKLCQFYLEQNNYFIFENSNELNENKISVGCDKNKLSHYCLEDCPFGFYKYNEESDKCLLCSSSNNDLHYFSATKTCKEYVEPNIRYPLEGKVYYDCEEANLKYFDNNCYKDCSEIYGQINNINECVTCESLNKVFSNGICDDTCQGQSYSIIRIEINKRKYSFCPNCEGKYYYNNSCYDECPLERHFNDPNNICYFCSQVYPDKKYYQNGECVSQCDRGYEPLINSNDDNDYYCNYCKDEGKYYKNGKCEENCSDGYGINKTDNICEFCGGTNNSYYLNTCLSECPDDYGLFENNICINCSSKGLLLKENECVTSCENYIREGFKCIICPNKAVSKNSIYYFEYNCLEACPNYTVLEPEENRCKICNKKFQVEKCVEDCSEGYLNSRTYIPNTDFKVEICTQCGLNDSSWYDGKNCVDNCPTTKYASDDHFCRLCFCGFSKYTNCDNKSDKCNCINQNIENEEIFGNNCEFKKNKKEKLISIIPLGLVISSKKSYFTFNSTDEIKNKNISIKWAVYVNSSQITDMHSFASGMNEKNLIINYNVLKPNLNNTITLELNITDENNTIKSYNDELYISIQSLGQQNNVKILGSINSTNIINTVMNNNIIIKRDNLIGIEPYKFYYKILIKDENNEIIPIKQKRELQPFLDKQNQQLSMVLPFFTQFIFELSNNRGEKYNIYQEIENQNTFIEYSLEDIIRKNNTLEGHNEIEKIFLIMKYLDIYKNETISNSSYDLLFDFIKDKLIIAANANGYYEGVEVTKKEEDSIRYYINYYETKTIFSLLNKILLHQGINLAEKYYNVTFDIFNEFFDILIENGNSEKLDNSNILSFFRTFDHLLEIYIKKDRNEGKNITNKKVIFELINKVLEYLKNEIYPGETIRLVGKRVSLILSRFGEYQNNISFPAISNIEKNIKYDDYNTFSFDDYYLNQEVCDDDGNTLLCINNDNYKKFKSNLEDIYLTFFSFNSNVNIAQSENRGNSFRLKFMTNDSKYLNDSNGIFYDIEFPFNYISTSNDLKQFYNNDNNNKDYSNIACVPKNYLKNDSLYCFTYFNYQTNITKCSCNVLDEITYISDYEMAKFYKDIQYKYKSKYKSFNLINKLSAFIVFILFILVFLPNLFYLLYDLKNDIIKANYKLLSLREKIKQRYSETKILNNSSVFSFSIYLFVFKFPLLSALRNCNFKSPKYIKHFINTLSIFYGFILSLAIFTFYIPFKEMNDIIDKRDIKNPNFEIKDPHIKYKYLNLGIVFSIFGVCFIRLFIYIFGIILSYNKDDLKYWRELKNIFTNYVMNYIKREVLLDSTWEKAKTRMIAYVRICGNYVLDKKAKKAKKINKKFENYLKASQASENKKLLLPLYECDEEMAELSNKNTNSENNKSSKNYFENNRFSVSKINDYSLDNENSNLRIINAENFQLYSTKIKPNKEIIKNNKFERIKNKYICQKNNKDALEEEIISENESFSHEYSKQFEIVNEYNLSYYALKDFISNEVINKCLTKEGNSTFISSINYKPEGFNLLICINIILFILLFALICIIITTIKVILNNFGIFIINIWLSTFILILIVVYPLLYFIKSLIGSILLFKYYHLKNRCLCKILFWLFVDKTMIYIFKVRNYITKYKKEITY